MAAQIPFIHDIIKNNPLALQSSSTAIKKQLIAHPEIPLEDVLPRYIIPILTEKGVELVDFFDDKSLPNGIEFTFNYFFNDPSLSYKRINRRYDNKRRQTIDPKILNPNSNDNPDPNLDSAEEVTLY